MSLRPSPIVALVVALAAAAHAATVTRGPYLQTMTPTSVVVRWRTDVPTTSRVDVGPSPGSLGTTVSDPASTTEHVVAVGGLAPDTAWVYAIGSDSETLEGDDLAHVFRTAPTPGVPHAFRAWVTGDGGFANANGQAVRDAYATFAAGTPTDLWLLLGDNAYLVGSDADFQAALFDMHHDLLLRTPPWPTFGNHEALSSNSLTQTGPYFDMFTLPTAGQAGGVASGSEAYYAFDWANVHFIVLDSEHNANTPGSPMMTWLEADLQATTADWVVAFWHRPPYSKGLLHDSDLEAAEIAMRTNVVPLLESYGVDLVLCGHSHSYERSGLIDGHYGPSSSFGVANVKDGGNGDPATDGPYRKPSGTPAAHDGAVFMVAGSSSEVRPTTLNHPAMRVGLLQLGSVVLDVDGDTLTSRFLNAAGQVTDSFRIVKGAFGCGTAPRAGCRAGMKGRLLLEKHPGRPSADRLAWTLRGGMLDAASVGAPEQRTELAVCVYDAAGALVGGTLPSVAGWRTRGLTSRYRDDGGSHAGFTSVRLRRATGAGARFVAKARGASLAVPSLPATPPLTAQVVNVDSGVCWESALGDVRRNDAGAVIVTQP